jgi:hypothetical protein
MTGTLRVVASRMGFVRDVRVSRPRPTELADFGCVEFASAAEAMMAAEQWNGSQAFGSAVVAYTSLPFFA